MIRRFTRAAALVAFGLPMAVHAQGLVRGAEEGAAVGRAQGGPVGEVVGGAIGAATGTVNGILGIDTRPRFRSYAVREARPSYAYDGELRVGSVLPSAGVTYYEVPDEYGARDYRYTVVNGRHVLVDPRTRRVVEIVD